MIDQLDGSARLAYVSFVDASLPNGPGVNEREFIRWLSARAPGAYALVVKKLPDVTGLQQRVIGRVSLRNPFRHLLAQLKALCLLRRALPNQAILYYRHSRLVILVPLLRLVRPDVRVAAVRVSGAKLSDSAAISGVRGCIARLVESLDWTLRRYLARTCLWVDCVTDIQASTLADASGSEVHVVPNGVNTRDFQPLCLAEREAARQAVGLPAGAVVIGYCGGAPMQRGAVQVREAVEAGEDVYGLVVGRLSESEANSLSHPRLVLYGEVEFEAIPPLVGMMDIGLAFDDPHRAALVGNSNQKVRQYLACGAFVVTHQSDIDFRNRPFLGLDLPAGGSVSAEWMPVAVAQLGKRDARVSYARQSLEVTKIFDERHEKVLRLAGGH